MPCFVTRCPTQIVDVLFQYLSPDFLSWKMRKEGQHIFLEPSQRHCFVLNSFPKFNLFQIKVYCIKNFKKKEEVPFMDIKPQLYRFYFEFVVLSKIPCFRHSTWTLFSMVYLQLSTNDLFFCRYHLKI